MRPQREPLPDERPAAAGLQLGCRLSRRLLAFGLQPRDLNASRFLTSGLLPLRLQLGCRLSRRLLAFGLQPRDLDASRFLTSGLLPLRLQLGCRLSRLLLAFGLQPRDLDASRFLTSGLFPLLFLRSVAGIWRRRGLALRT